MGDYPVEARSIQSLLGEELDRRGVASGADDQAPFMMNLLHVRRTFVEKLFTIHDRVERLVIGEGRQLGSYARHYYDLHRLLQRDEVQRTLRSTEYADIAADYQRLSTKHFSNQVLPEGMRLYDSPALFPNAELRSRLQPSYTEQCERLCYGAAPSFEEVLSGFEGIREYLQRLPVPP